MAVDVPESYKLAEELTDNGLEIKGTVLTEKQLVKAIALAKGWSGC